MKKLISLVLVMVMMVTLFAACGSNSTATDSQASSSQATAGSSETSASSSKAGGTLNIFGCLQQQEKQPDGWAEIAKNFEAETGIKVNYTWKGQWSEIPQNLTAAKLAGEKIDLVHTGVGLVMSSLAPSGMVMDLTELIAPIKDRFAPGILETTTAGGKIWSMPVIDSGTSLIYYNKTIFDELGIKEPATYEELVAASKLIKEKKKIMPMIHQGKDSWMWPMWFFESYGQVLNGGSVPAIQKFLSGETKFTGENEAKAFSLIKKFMDDGILTKESLDTNRDGMLAVFMQQKAAMFYGGTWEFSSVKSGVKDFEWDVMEFPQVIPGAKLAHGGGPNGTVIIPTFCDQDNLGNTMKYVEYFTRPEVNQIVMNIVDPLMSGLNGIKVMDDPRAEKLNSKFLPNTVAFLDWIWPVEVNDAFTQSIPAVMNGSMSPEQATEVVQKAYDTLVKEKNYSYNWYDKFTADDWAKVTPKSIPQYEVK